MLNLQGKSSGLFTHLLKASITRLTIYLTFFFFLNIKKPATDLNAEFLKDRTPQSSLC